MSAPGSLKLMLRRGISLHGAAAAVLLAACTPTTTPDAGQKAAAAEDYPSLNTVPPRPHLTYTVPQRKQIADALVSDRANARYERDQIRYETGQSQTPPPAAPPKAVAEPEVIEGAPEPPPPPPPPPIAGGGTVAETYVNQAILTETNDGSLADFLRILQRQQDLIQQAEAAGLSIPPTGGTAAPGELGPQGPAPAPAPEAVATPAPAPVAEAAPSPPPPVPPDPAPAPVAATPPEPAPAPVAAAPPEPAPAPVAAAPPEPAPAPTAAAPPEPAPAPVAVVAAAEPAPAPTAKLVGKGGLVASLAFAKDSAKPPENAAAVLGPAIEEARAGEGKIAIVGRGDDPALGLDRARAVAQLMLKLGLPADRLALRGGGSGSDVQVYLLPSGPA